MLDTLTFFALIVAVPVVVVLLGAYLGILLSRPPVRKQEQVECPNCFGSGLDLDVFNEEIVCTLCGGEGTIDESRADAWNAGESLLPL